LFDARGFKPIYLERRKDGDASFWFGKHSDEARYRIVTAIPREFYALQAVIGDVR
jgi:hypothetical protein